MERFGWTDGDVTLSQCAVCRHKNRTPTCRAFPKRIPLAILSGEHDHRNPYPGDNGVRFEPLPGETHPNEGTK